MGSGRAAGAGAGDADDELVAQEKGTELTYRAEGTCTMLATRDEIHQIIYNLTDNAVKYTPPGSTVQVSLFREGDQVVLTVEDNGSGIPEEDLPRIFDKGFTGQNGRQAAQNATGLGLYLCQRLCRKLDIGLAAQSSPEGTTHDPHLPGQPTSSTRSRGN